MDQVEYLGASGTIHSLNLFTYCEVNPVNYIAPYGNYGLIALIIVLVTTLTYAVVNVSPLDENGQETKPSVVTKKKIEEIDNIIEKYVSDHIQDTIERGPGEGAANIYQSCGGLGGGLGGTFNNTASYDERYDIWDIIIG